MKSFFLLISLVITGILFSCHPKEYKALDISSKFRYVKKVIHSQKRVDKFGNIVGEKVVIFPGGESKMNWTIYQSMDKQIEFNVPSDWKLEEKEGSLVFCSGRPKEAFSLIAYDKSENSIDLDKYVKYIYAKMASDTSWEFISNDVKKMHSNEKNIYTFSWKAKKGKTIYKGYSYFLDDDKNVYDFTYKNNIENVKPRMKPIFDIVVGSFVFNGVLFCSDRYSKVTHVSIGIE